MPERYCINCDKITENEIHSQVNNKMKSYEIIECKECGLHFR